MRTHRVFVRFVISLSVLTSAALLVACGTERVPASSRGSSSEPSSATAGGTALLSTESGIVAVDEGTTQVRWSAPGAVAALDGSALFARDSGSLVRLDPTTGKTLGSWPIDAALNPIVVAPNGRWVALTNRSAYDTSDPAVDATKIVVVDGSSGAPIAAFDLAGNIEPEAFSSDGTLLIVLDHHEVGYRVRGLVVATGELFDTSDDNKNPIGDMTGHRVRGVLSEDGQLLATLYQNPGDPEVPAFVHVLDLSGFAYCVNLPAEFGESPDGNVLIERAGDTVIVISEHADRRAEFSLADLRRLGSTGLDVTVTEGTGARADAAYVEVPGYRALIATL